MMTKSVVIVWMTAIIMAESCKATLDESKVIHVSGKVMSQDCSQGWNEWVEGAKPIQGSIVSITCLDDHKRAAYYGSDATDEDGEFNMVVDKSVHDKDLKPKDCLVRLVSSPDEEYNVPSDLGHGNLGVKLRQPSVVYRDITKYVVGPFYYTTTTCDDEPDVDSTGEGSY